MLLYSIFFLYLWTTHYIHRVLHYISYENVHVYDLSVSDLFLVWRFYPLDTGTWKMRNEPKPNETQFTETKRNLPKNETKSMRNEINRNEIDRKETKRYNTKWNKTYFNETISWGKTRPQLNEKNRENII
jgi:hypothetical protein